MPGLHELRWDGGPGHYEVHYLTLTDPASGAGVWIRFTLLAPAATAGPPEPPTCSLWFVATFPDAPAVARKTTLPINELAAVADPFSLRIGAALLTATVSRRVLAETFAPRSSLAGVAYTDPDGRRAYCYNSEVASMRVSVLDRSSTRPSRWVPRAVLHSAGRAHFEYGQRAPVPGLPPLLP